MSHRSAPLISERVSRRALPQSPYSSRLWTSRDPFISVAVDCQTRDTRSTLAQHPDGRGWTGRHSETHIYCPPSRLLSPSTRLSRPTFNSQTYNSSFTPPHNLSHTYPLLCSPLPLPFFLLPCSTGSSPSRSTPSRLRPGASASLWLASTVVTGKSFL